MNKILAKMSKWQENPHYPVGAAIVLGALAMGMFILIWSTFINEERRSYQKETAKQVMLVEREMNKRFDIVEVIANMGELGSDNLSFAEKAKQINHKAVNKGLVRIGIADQDGMAYAQDGNAVDISDRDYFIQAKQGEKTIDGPIISRRDGHKGIIYAQPIYSHENVEGVLYALYDFEYIRNLLLQMSEDLLWSTLILDDENQVVFSKLTSASEMTELDADRLTSQLGETLMGGGEAATTMGYATLDNQHVFWTLEPITGTPWKFIRVAPTQDAFEMVNKVIGIIGLIFITVIAAIYIKMNGVWSQNKKKVQETENLHNIMVLRVNQEGRVIYANKFARAHLGYSSDEILKKKITELLVYKEQEQIKAILERNEDSPRIMSIAMNFQTKEYKRLYAICTIKGLGEMLDHQGVEISAVDVSQYNLVDTDKEVISNLYQLIASSEEELQVHAKELMAKQSQLEENEKQLKRMVYYDELTQLPSKNLIKERILKYIEEEPKFALVAMDVDNFKFVNDSFGHDYGDEILIAIADKLQQIREASIEVFRLGADEFAMVIKDQDDKEKIKSLLEHIQNLFGEPFVVNDIKFYVSFSMGVATYPKDGKSYNELMTNADTAMNRAKENGKRHYIFFDHEFKAALLERIKTENDLRRAIKAKEFVLYYQPQTDIKTGKIRGFEALIRWIDGDGNIIPPFKFIDIAEESGLIVPIGQWVIEEACGFINRLVEHGYNNLYVAVNVSVVQLIQDDFAEILEKIIEETQVNPKLLHIEITETILMESIDANIKTIEQIKLQGAQVSLDDFGKGYSSLTYLKKLPIDVLKIEKTFIDDILIDKEKNITSAIINLGHDLDLEVVAEGVETEEQKEYLVNYGCDIIQGYLVSKPIPEVEIVSLLKKYND